MSERGFRTGKKGRKKNSPLFLGIGINNGDRPRQENAGGLPNPKAVKGERHDRRGQKGLSCSRPGNSVSKAGLFLPGKSGLSVVSPVPGDDFKGIGSGEVQAGKDVGQKEGDLGKSQEGFFFENFRRGLLKLPEFQNKKTKTSDDHFRDLSQGG